MSIYFDNAATTPLAPEVKEELLRIFDRPPGNSSSIHSHGVNSSLIVEAARANVARILGCHPDEIFFTSGGTESNNWVFTGIAEDPSVPKHVVVSSIEHASILGPVNHLEKKGWKVTRLPVSSEGIVSPSTLDTVLSQTPAALVSVMTANNEIGSLQDISALSCVCRKHQTLFHTDATQAVGKIPLNLSEQMVDFLTFSAHKIHGPLGVGALFIRKGRDLPPLLLGGPQEANHRAGTVNNAAIAGLSVALTISSPTPSELTERLIEEILKTISRAQLNGPRMNRLPGNVHFSFPGFEGRKLLRELDRRGFIVSTGSACSAGMNIPSHVLLALGKSHEEALSSLRISLSRYNSRDEVDAFLAAFKDIIVKHP
ncbi:MAG: cysteine desulfurase family protein [Bacteriovoracaceae bacterium]